MSFLVLSRSFSAVFTFVKKSLSFSEDLIATSASPGPAQHFHSWLRAGRYVLLYCEVFWCRSVLAVSCLYICMCTHAYCCSTWFSLCCLVMNSGCLCPSIFCLFVICSKLKIWKSDLLIAEQYVWSLASLFILFHLFFNDVNKHWARCSSLHLQHERKAAIKTKAAKLNPGPRRLRQHDEPECALGNINNILNC